MATEQMKHRAAEWEAHVNKEEKKMSCSGGCPMANADGPAKTEAPKPAAQPVISEKVTNTLILSGVALVITAMGIAVAMSFRKH